MNRDRDEWRRRLAENVRWLENRMEEQGPDVGAAVLIFQTNIVNESVWTRRYGRPM